MVTVCCLGGLGVVLGGLVGAETTTVGWLDCFIAVAALVVSCTPTLYTAAATVPAGCRLGGRAVAPHPTVNISTTPINFLTGGYFKMDPWVKKLLKAQ